MSKRKKELDKEQKLIRQGEADHHHLCFPRKGWVSENRLRLRRMHYCIVVLKKRLHNRIHMEIGVVSIPPDEVAGEVADKLEAMLISGEISCQDPPEDRLRVLAKLFEEKATWTANALYEQARIIDEYNRRLSD